MDLNGSEETAWRIRFCILEAYEGMSKPLFRV